MLVLEVQDGNSNKSLFEFGMGQFVLGKGDHCDLILSDCHVSRSHASIDVSQTQVTIKDLDSTNGTWVNGERIEQVAPISLGDRVTFGDLSLVILDLVTTQRKTSKPTILPDVKTTTAAASEAVAESTVEPVPLKQQEISKKPAETKPLSTVNIEKEPKANATNEKQSVQPSTNIKLEQPKPLSGAEFQLLKHKIFKRLRHQFNETIPAKDYVNQVVTVARNIPEDITEFEAKFTKEFSQQRLAEEVADELWGLGPLSRHIRQLDFETIYVDGPSKITIETNAGSKIEKMGFLDVNSYRDTIARISTYPTMIKEPDSSLTSEFALASNVVATLIDSPYLLGEPRLVIRHTESKPASLNDLVKCEFISQQATDFLRQAILNNKNIIISGRDGCGKAVLLKALRECFGVSERIISIEQYPVSDMDSGSEISLVVNSNEAESPASVTELLSVALRLRPDRLLLAQLDTESIETVFDVATSGVKTLATTLKSDSPTSAIKRLEQMLMLAAPSRVPDSARQMLLNSFDLVVQVAKLPDGQRKVTQISEVASVAAGDISLIDVFKLEQPTDPTQPYKLGLLATGYKPLSLQEF